MTTRQKITADSEVFTFEGSISIEKGDNWVRPWRIPFYKKDFFPVLSENVGKRCSCTRICFSTNTENIILEIPEEVEGMMFDLFSDGIFIQRNILLKGQTQTAFL